MCSDAWYTATLEVKTRTEICGAFDLIETNRPVDFSPWADAFRSKPSAFAYNFRRNFGKLVERLQGHVNAR
jgi:hypothetical protein